MTFFGLVVGQIKFRCMIKGCGLSRVSGQRWFWRQETRREGQEGQHPGDAQGDEGGDGDQDQPRAGGGDQGKCCPFLKMYRLIQ